MCIRDSLNTGHGEAIELACICRADEGLASKSAAIDLTVGTDDILPERFHQVAFNRIPQKDIVADLVEVDERQALVYQRLARRRLARAHTCLLYTSRCV